MAAEPGRFCPAGYGYPSGVPDEEVALEYDDAAWRAQFLRAWPPGSQAHQSYWKRICEGPAHALALAAPTMLEAERVQA